MSVHLRCGACGHGYVIDAAEAEASPEGLPCPACGGTMGPAAPEASAVAAASEDPAATAPLWKAQAAAVPEPGEQVVCPRCGLHFRPRPGESIHASNGRPTILLVEDMEYFREIVQDSLSERFHLKTADSAERAMETLSAGGIDLLVIDLTLGDSEEGGLRLLGHLQPKPCPVLIFTARDESEINRDWDQLQALGADDVVRKGMNAGEALSRKCCELLGLPVDEDDPA